MKKLLIIGSLVAVVVLVLGVAGYAYAQTQQPPEGTDLYGPGMMNRQDGWEMMGGRGGGFGRGMVGGGGMQAYLVPALAQAFGLTEDELQARFYAGDTMWVIAQEQGLTVEEFSAKMIQAHAAALGKMVEEGVITQAQSERMLTQMTKALENGNGCGMLGAGAGFRMGARRGFGMGARAGFEVGLRAGLDGETPLHDYALAGFAEALGLTVDEINERLSAGERMNEIALSTGMTEEEFADLVIEVRSEAINQAVADGIITQAQADWMLEHIEWRADKGFGPSFRWFDPDNARP